MHIFVESNKTQNGRQGKQDKQSKLDSFASQTPNASNKRDPPESSPDNSSPSTQHLENKRGFLLLVHP